MCPLGSLLHLPPLLGFLLPDKLSFILVRRAPGTNVPIPSPALLRASTSDHASTSACDTEALFFLLYRDLGEFSQARHIPKKSLKKKNIKSRETEIRMKNDHYRLWVKTLFLSSCRGLGGGWLGRILVSQS